MSGADQLFVWPWLLIRMKPVALPDRVISFADLWTGRDEEDRYAIAVDLRNETRGPPIVRAKIGSDGNLPTWPADAPGVIATDFAAWRAAMRLSAVYAAYGQAVRQIRFQRGISVKQLADLAGLDLASVSALEKGDHDQTLATMLTIAEGLETHVSDLALTAERLLGR
jgi:DNA-binding XRE family transcriptional regulator